MHIGIDIQKRHFYVLMAAIALLFGAVMVIAFGGNNPSVFGHSAGELAITIPTQVSGFPNQVKTCLAATSCTTDTTCGSTQQITHCGCDCNGVAMTRVDGTGGFCSCNCLSATTIQTTIACGSLA